MRKLIPGMFLLAFSAAALAQDAPAESALPPGAAMPAVEQFVPPAPPADTPPVPPAPPARPPVITVMPGENLGSMRAANILPVTGPVAYTLDGAMLRASPSSKGRVIARLRTGLRVDRYATLQVGENLWWQTEIEGLGSGWVSERDLNGAP